MKKLIKKIALFLLPVLLTWGGLEYFYRTTENNYSYKHKRITAVAKDVEVLILGDSHTFFGLNPEYFNKNVFNLSGISQSIYFDKLLFEKHIDDLENLEHLVLMVNYTTLSKVDNTMEDKWRKYFYKHQMDLEVDMVSSFNIKNYSLALTRRLNKSVQLIGKYRNEGTIVGVNDNGWGNYYSSTNNKDLERTSKIVTKRHEDGLTDFKLNLERVQDMIKICKNRGVQVHIISMPVSENYYSKIDAQKWSKIAGACVSLTKKNENVKYYNWFKDSRFLSEDFYDANHLNDKGAKKCSEFLNLEVN